MNRDLMIAMLESIRDNQDEIIEDFINDSVKEAVAYITSSLSHNILQDQIIQAIEMYDFESPLIDDFETCISELERKINIM